MSIPRLSAGNVSLAKNAKTRRYLLNFCSGLCCQILCGPALWQSMSSSFSSSDMMLSDSRDCIGSTE